jgi:ubiquinone/menaquinone biosynthesis C-methylase UbiE
MRKEGFMNWIEKLFINSPLHSVELKKFASFMVQTGGDVKGGKVMEIGCGRGIGVDVIFELFGASYVEAFDYDPAQVRLAKKRLLSRYNDKVRIYEASATQIPSPDSQFDAVFDFGALHHIPDNQSAINEVARVLKHGGRFFFQEPLSTITLNPAFCFLFGDLAEAQFSWVELTEKLTRAGLTVVKDSCSVKSVWVVGMARKDI